MTVHQIREHLADIDLLHPKVPFLQSTLHRNQPALPRPGIANRQGNAPLLLLLLLVVLDPHQKIVSATDLLVQVIKRRLEEDRHREIDIGRIIVQVEIIAVIDILAHALAPDLQRKEDAIALHLLVTIIGAAAESIDTLEVEAQVDNEKEVVDAELHYMEVIS